MPVFVLSCFTFFLLNHAASVQSGHGRFFAELFEDQGDFGCLYLVDSFNSEFSKFFEQDYVPTDKYFTSHLRPNETREIINVYGGCTGALVLVLPSVQDHDLASAINVRLNNSDYKVTSKQKFFKLNSSCSGSISS